MRSFAGLILSVALLTGCSTSRLLVDQEYQERPSLETSLFRGDQDYISEEAVQQILAGRIEIPQRAKVAIFRYQGAEEAFYARSAYGYSYWRTEAYIKAQEELVDVLQSALDNSGRVSEATILPSMLVPTRPSITMLRQAAVRLQADLLLIYRITSDVYSDYSLFSRHRVKAYSSCEALLFDVRTGIIPFTTIVSRDVLREKTSEDVANSEVARLAQHEASLEAIRFVGVELAEFLRDIR